MDHQNYCRRYPFVIADDAGSILFSSPPSLNIGDNIFSYDNLSAADIKLAKKRIFSGRYDNSILLRNKRDGKAVIISPCLFPSTRTLAVLYTDIDYGIAADLCNLHFPEVAVNERNNIKETIRHERVYPVLSNVIFSSRIMFNANYNAEYEDDFGMYLRDKIKEIAHLTYCSFDLIFEDELSPDMIESFDGGIFSFYMLLMLSVASELSPERKADIRLSRRQNDLKVKIYIDAPHDKKYIEGFEYRFKYALYKLDEVCYRINIPSYFIRNGVFETGIIPSRPDFSKAELKAREGYLKDQEQDKDYQRNIFIFVSASIEE